MQNKRGAQGPNYNMACRAGWGTVARAGRDMSVSGDLSREKPLHALLRQLGGRNTD